MATNMVKLQDRLLQANYGVLKYKGEGPGRPWPVIMFEDLLISLMPCLPVSSNELITH